MKILILFATILSFSLANEIYEFENVEFELDHDLSDEFVKTLETANSQSANAGITANVNEYADRLFANIETFALSNGLDPVHLQNISQHFLTASLTLNHGLLHGISSISRTKDVQLTYRTASKEMEIDLPIVFSNLNFTYDYHVVVLLIGPRGGMTGKIRNFNMDIKLLFDFNTYQAKIKSLKTTNTGHVSLTFEGNGVVDLVVNILSQFVTTILHPLIVGVIEGIVSSVMKQVVGSVNGALNNTLHPSNQTFAAFY